MVDAFIAEALEEGEDTRCRGIHAIDFPTDSLFDQFARAVCEVLVVPRKEVFEDSGGQLPGHLPLPAAQLPGLVLPHRGRQRLQV